MLRIGVNKTGITERLFPKIFKKGRKREEEEGRRKVKGHFCKFALVPHTINVKRQHDSYTCPNCSPFYLWNAQKSQEEGKCLDS